MAPAVKKEKIFNVKHLTVGDPLPPFNGKLRLYSMRYCPFSHRAILALNAKKLDYEVINITFEDKPTWLYIKNPFGNVPILEVEDGLTVNESLVIVEYLDDVYTERPLLPKDPVQKAVDKAIVGAFSLVHELFFRLVNEPKSATDSIVSTYFRALDYTQEELEKRGTAYLHGNEPGYVDYMIWPWLERMLTVDDPRIKLDQWNYRLLLSYIKKMAADPIVVGCSMPAEFYKTFHASFLKGERPPYDQTI